VPTVDITPGWPPRQEQARDLGTSSRPVTALPRGASFLEGLAIQKRIHKAKADERIDSIRLAVANILAPKEGLCPRLIEVADRLGCLHRILAGMMCGIISRRCCQIVRPVIITQQPPRNHPRTAQTGQDSHTGTGSEWVRHGCQRNS
jgi:hypothetical protein